MDTLQKIKFRIKAGVSSAEDEYDRRVKDRVLISGLKGLHREKLYITDYQALLSKAKELDKLYEKVPESRRVSAVVLLDAHASATIEGARTTVERVKQCLDNPVSKDEKMVANTYKGCIFAYDHRITPGNIRKLWEIIVKDTCENEDLKGSLYRDGMVYVGSDRKIIHEPAGADQIETLMNALFDYADDKDENAFLKSFFVHFYFVYVHPFCDGNGRMARTLTSSELYHSGYRKMKSLPLASTINSRVQEYYRKISEAEEPVEETDGTKWLDISPFLDYMLDAFEQCIVNAFLSENELTDHEKLILQKMNKKGTGAEITVQNAMKITGLSETTSRNILNSLSNKGYLRIEKGQKRYVYSLIAGLGGD